MSRLALIQVTAQQEAEAMSSILNMDVTVVDEMMVCIAGTGIHKDTIGKKIIGNSVFRQVLEQSQECIITDVSTHDGCGLCDKRSKARKAAGGSSTVLITGESGTGKEDRQGRQARKYLPGPSNYAKILTASAADARMSGENI